VPLTTAPATLEMRQKTDACKTPRARVRAARGWAHAVEHEIVGRLAARIEAVLLRMQPGVGRAAAVELREQRTEPVRGARK